MDAQATLGLSGAYTPVKMDANWRTNRKKEIRREIVAWKIRHFFFQRWREVPLEFCLFVIGLFVKVVPGLNLPMHGRLYSKVFKGAQLVYPGWEFVGQVGDELVWQLPTEEDDEEGAYGETRSLSIADAERRGVEIYDYGHVGCHLITTAGKAFVASVFNNVAEPEILKYHGSGTGTAAANVADTTLATELTTEYVTNSTRPTGSQANSAATYTTVGTLSPDSGGTIAVTEWGLFSASSSGTLLDRQVYSAQNIVAAADSQQNTYVLTIA